MSAKERDESFTEVVRGKIPMSLKKRIVNYGKRKLMLEAEIVRQAVREYIEREEERERVCEAAAPPHIPGSMEQLPPNYRRKPNSTEGQGQAGDEDKANRVKPK